MFFTKVGLLIAWLLFVTSAMNLGIAFVALATGSAEEVTRILGRGPFMLIDANAKYLAIGVAFGVAAEISKSIGALRQAAVKGKVADQP